MTQRTHSRRMPFLGGLLLLLVAPLRSWAEPNPAAISAFRLYVATVETRLLAQHRMRDGFLAGPFPNPQREQRLRQGNTIVEPVREPQPGADPELPGALLHHWRGTAFVPGATAADFERLLRDFNNYPQRFAPQVLRAKVLTRQGDHFEASIRVRQKHVITVVMDSTYDVMFGRLDALDGYSTSRSMAIYEIDGAGTEKERALSTKEEHGFLWRLNTYWSWEERDGGLYIQIESVSLSRAIPTGLGWALRPYVESVPRESLEFTLRSASDALRK